MLNSIFESANIFQKLLAIFIAAARIIWNLCRSQHVRIKRVFDLLTQFIIDEYFIWSYLTPQGTQGFAPHYDDIEAFVLQLEGKKRWRVYKPLFKEEVLPRFSSGNYEQSQLEAPIIDVVLEAGDLLYFPRGYIHQVT